MALLLGIDTGGTYTDAVLCDEARPGLPVVAKAKALTTREDLALGIGGAVARVLEDSGASADQIALTSVSTTLATNALVEGRGGRVALVFIGFADSDLQNGGLPAALAGDPAIQIAGGHTPHGEERAPLDLEHLARALEPISDAVEGFAVVAHFGVRNPAHEIAARDLILERTGRPVTCGHELSAQLNGPKRALTCVLNARLIGMITELIEATKTTIGKQGIASPLMLVRGDGSLVSAEFARARPIETILSGPAASLIGAAHLTGLRDAVISDIGGTTTDIAILRDGRPSLRPEGAVVGGHHTMVEAVDMITHGLGGDSEIRVDDSARQTMLRIGPRRLIPVCLIAGTYPAVVREALDRQVRSDMPAEFDGRFLLADPKALGGINGLRDAERRLLDSLGDGPKPQDAVITRRLQIGALARLVTLGFVRVAGFTPSDAAHVLGLHDAWDRDAALDAARLFARRRDARGDVVAPSAEGLSKSVLATLVRTSSEALLGATLARDGITAIGASESRLIAAALDRSSRATRLDIGIDLPIVGLGASAPVYYPRIASMLGAPSVVPDHADVANAVGAVAGRVEIRRETIILPTETGTFRVPDQPEPVDFAALEQAVDHARDLTIAAARSDAIAAGASEVEIRDHFEEDTVIVDGAPVFVQGRLTVSATGRPRLSEAALENEADASVPRGPGSDSREQRIALVRRVFMDNGVAAGRVRDWPVVADSFERLAMLDPADALAWRNIGFVARMRGNPDLEEAHVGYHRALILEPGSAEYLHDMARLGRERKRPRDAMRCSRRAIMLKPDGLDHYVMGSAAGHDLSDMGAAWPMCLRARAIRPDSVAALSNLARVLVRRGHYGLVGRATRRLLCADPQAKGAGAMLTSAWTSIARTDEAIEVARRTLLMTPLDGELWGTLARAQLKTGAREQAIDSVRRCCLIRPTSSIALLTLAEASVEREDLSLCEISSRWLRVIASDRGKGIADSIATSGRPAVYVHVPKTAGSSIQRSTYAFTTTIGHRWIEFAPTEEDRHYGAWVAPNLLINPKVLERRYVFSNTRHLLPFLVSFYEHCRRGFASPSMIERCRQARSEPFSDFLQRIAEADTPWISRRFIFAPFFDRASGQFIIDWVNRTEQVDDDLPLMCKQRRFPYRGVGRNNRQVKASWKEYFTEDLIDLAWTVWAREVALFGYTRDGGYTETALLHRDVRRFKHRLSYDWRDDTLRLDGAVLDGTETAASRRAAGR